LRIVSAERSKARFDLFVPVHQIIPPVTLFPKEEILYLLVDPLSPALTFGPEFKKEGESVLVPMGTHVTFFPGSPDTHFYPPLSLCPKLREYRPT
jgi:hypothetical protein